MYGGTKEAVKSAFFRIVDLADRNACGVNWWALSEPAFWRGSVPGHIRDAEGWLDPEIPGPRYICTYVPCSCDWLDLALVGVAWHSIRSLTCLGVAWLHGLRMCVALLACFGLARLEGLESLAWLGWRAWHS